MPQYGLYGCSHSSGGHQLSHNEQQSYGRASPYSNPWPEERRLSRQSSGTYTPIYAPNPNGLPAYPSSRPQLLQYPYPDSSAPRYTHSLQPTRRLSLPHSPTRSEYDPCARPHQSRSPHYAYETRRYTDPRGPTPGLMVRYRYEESSYPVEGSEGRPTFAEVRAESKIVSRIGEMEAITDLDGYRHRRMYEQGDMGQLFDPRVDEDYEDEDDSDESDENSDEDVDSILNGPDGDELALTSQSSPSSSGYESSSSSNHDDDSSDSGEDSDSSGYDSD